MTISRDFSFSNSYSKGMHRRLCKQVNWSDWQVTGGQSGGSSLPSRQSGEKSHFHLRGMHFWPSAHWKTSGSLQSRLTSRRCCSWPCTIAKDNRVISLNMIMLMSWIRETFLQTEMSAADALKFKEIEVVAVAGLLLVHDADGVSCFAVSTWPCFETS